MSSTHKLIKDLLIFYGTENYKKYLEEHNIQKIPVDQLDRIVTNIYNEKKTHAKQFLKDSLKKIMKKEYIGDLAFLTISNEIFDDDDLVIRRLILEIKEIQGE